MDKHPALEPPPRVEVTAEFIRDGIEKQHAYEQSRRLWTAQFTPSDPRAQPAARSRSRGTVHDSRQKKLDL
jgi:hypothetical protein